MSNSPTEVAREVVRVSSVAPGTGVTIYGIVHGGLPLLVAGLTAVLLVIQILVAFRALRKKSG